MRPVKRTIAASRLILGGTSSSSTDREGEQRADVLAVRFLQAEHDLEDGQGCPRFHVVGGDVEPVPPVRNSHLRGTGPSFCACPTKFPAVARVQSKGRPAGPGVTGAIPERTCSSGTQRETLCEAGHGPPAPVPRATRWSPGGPGRGDNGSPAAPRRSRAGRAASTLGEAACGSSRPGRRTGGNNEGFTSAAGHHRRGASHRPGAAAAGSAAGVIHHTRALHQVPDRT